MLRVIPSSAMTHCFDGVRIPASALGVACSVEQQEAYARRRAAAIVAQAHAQAEFLRRRAAEDAYREARVHAASVLAGIVQDIGSLRSVLLETTLTQVRQCLRQHCAKAGFTAAWLEQACQFAANECVAPPRVRVPSADQALFADLRAALDAAIAVEQADIACLRVEADSLILEYDPEHVVFDGAANPPGVDAQALGEGLAAVASRYADAIVGPLPPSHLSE